MTRSMEKDKHSITYTYNVKDLSKADMLVYIARMLRGKGITEHGVILTQPKENDDWPGDAKQIPVIPGENEFAAQYKDVPITCVTAVMEYHRQTLMIAYKPEDNLLSVILPHEFRATIDDIERDVIPDEIDLNYDNH